MSALWPLRCPLVMMLCPLGGRVGARVGVGGARCARGPVGWDEMQGEGTGMGGWEIGEGVEWAGRGFWDYSGTPIGGR
jgi:hypothetical protein